MDKKSRHIKELTPEVIQAYHSGKLAPSEMHQVELLMLENSFYNEGLEGLQSLDSTTFESDIKELSKRIDKTTEKKKTIFWTIYIKVAAAVLLFMTFTALLYFSRQATFPSKELSKLQTHENPQGKDSISINKRTIQNIDSNSIKPKPKSPATQVVGNRLEKDRSETLDSNTNESEVMKRYVTQSPNEDKTKITKLSNPLKKDVESPKNINITVDETTSQSIKSKIETDLKRLDTMRAMRSDQVFTDYKTAPDSLSHVTKIDSSSYLIMNVISGIRVQTSEKKETAKGKLIYSPLKDSTLLSNRAITPKPNNIEKALSGKVAGVNTNSEKNKKTTYNSAKPEIGYPKFNRYLRKNLKYPESAREKKIKGRVTVQFRVSETGTLSNFQIIKSLGHGCDKEAIRLIKEGPKWFPKTEGPLKRPVSSTVKVKIRFKP